MCVCVYEHTVSLPNLQYKWKLGSHMPLHARIPQWCQFHVRHFVNSSLALWRCQKLKFCLPSAGVLSYKINPAVNLYSKACFYFKLVIFKLPVLIIKHGARSTAVMFWGWFSVMWTVDACEVSSAGWMTAEMLSGDISFALGHTVLLIPSIVWEGQMISQEKRFPTLEPRCLGPTSVTSICPCV